MRITDLLKPEGIKIGGSATDKMDAINQMVDLMAPVNRRARQESATASLFRMLRQTLSRRPVLLP